MNHAALNPFSLHGKNILITGASSQLGRRIAIRCSERGARIVATGRNEKRLQETYSQLLGDDHVQVLADLTQEKDLNNVAQLAPCLDGLVHCAGFQKQVSISHLSEELMTETYRVNFLAPVMLTQRLLQAGRITESGSILFILSTAAHTGSENFGAYSAMKSGLIGVIKCLAIEQAHQKIRVNGISPSRIFLTTGSTNQDLLKNNNLSPLGLGTHDDVANGAIYMLSDASRWVTGTSLIIDGGGRI